VKSDVDSKKTMLKSSYTDG